ncbi:MAG: thioredoxin fold domain-containing protein [Candidatus Obscuribacterales bacterium]|nr:thioredoxin fold domain-containing protein [Candidatus Obscuribacterales bacterium]
MARESLCKIALITLLSLSCPYSAGARPESFSGYSFQQARELAQKEHKFLLLDFTASWCPPCKKMEASTWTDESIKSWIKENAIAIQIDVDQDRSTTDKFNVKGMPTMVLFTPESGEKEFGRQDGYLSAAELLRWLEGAKSGKTAADLEKELDASGQAAVWDHMNKAREFQAAGKRTEEFNEYIWLWNNISVQDPNLAPLRLALVPSEMKKLSAVDPAAKAKLIELRDSAEKSKNLHDWILLNGVLDDPTRTLAWFDKSKTDPTQQENIRKHTTLLEPLLFSNSRWADAAKYLYPDPLVRIGEYYKRAQDLKKPRPDTEFAKDFDPFPSMVLLMYGAYIGANRDADAQKIADECLRLDGTQEMRDALNNMAKGMLQARNPAASKSPSTKSQ